MINHNRQSARLSVAIRRKHEQDYPCFFAGQIIEEAFELPNNDEPIVLPIIPISWVVHILKLNTIETGIDAMIPVSLYPFSGLSCGTSYRSTPCYLTVKPSVPRPPVFKMV